MKRLLPLDLARGFTVFFIPAIHVFMLYGTPAIHDSVFGNILSFIAEWPGAQVLMFVMGMSITLSKKSLAFHLNKAAILFLAGYALNFFKYGISYLMGVLPPAFVNDLHFTHQRPLLVNLLLIGDILQFAAVAIIILALLKKFKYGFFVAVLLTYLFVVFSPFGWDLHHKVFIIDFFLDLAGGRPDSVFFPLLPWLIYPLAGFTMGYYFQMPFASVTAVFVSGCMLIVAMLLMRGLGIDLPSTSFFRTYPDQTLLHLGFVFCWMAVWFWVCQLQRFDGLKAFAMLFCFCSKHISLIYFLQWVLIGGMLPVFGYQGLGLGYSLLVAGLVTGVVLMGVYKFHKSARLKGV